MAIGALLAAALSPAGCAGPVPRENLAPLASAPPAAGARAEASSPRAAPAETLTWRIGATDSLVVALMNQGARAARDEDFAQAANLYERALGANPADRRRREIGRRLDEVRFLQQAEEARWMLLEERPGEAKRLLAVMDTARADAPARALHRALARNAESALGIAEAVKLANAGRTEAARRAFRRALDSTDDPGQRAYITGHIRRLDRILSEGL